MHLTSFRQWKWKQLLTVLCLLLAGALPAPVLAQGTNGPTITAEAGFEGYCQHQTWTPVIINVANNGPDLEGQLQVLHGLDGNGQTVYAETINLPTTSRKTVTVYTYLANYESSLTVRLMNGNRAVASTLVSIQCLNDTDKLFGLVTETTTPFNVLGDLYAAGQHPYLAQIDVATLPDQAAGLQALDAMVISNIDTGGLSENQRTALAAWVSNGGQLIVTGGPDWQRTAAGLGDLLPIVPEGTTQVASMEGLTQVNAAQDGPMSGGLVAQGTVKGEAQILAQAGKVPLVIAQNKGLGEVVYLAFDPGQESLLHWDELEDFYGALIRPGKRTVTGMQGFLSSDAAYMAGASFPGQRIPNPIIVTGFLLLYVMVVGPANYIIVRVLKRREMAWFTIPAVVILFSLMAFSFGYLLRGTRPLLNRLSVVQIYNGADFARVDSVVGLFSPSRSTYQMEINTPALVMPVSNSSGGIGVQVPALIAQKAEGGTHIPEVKSEIGSVQVVTAAGQAAAPRIHGNLTLELKAIDAHITGEIINDSGVTLEDAVLIAFDGFYPLGRFEAGSRKEISVSRSSVRQASSIMPSNSPYSYGSSTHWLFGAIGDIGTKDARYNHRYWLVSALIGSNGYYSYSGMVSHMNGAYLTGWSSETLIDASLPGQNSRNTDSTLYVVRFEPALSTGNDRMELTPGLFSLNLLETPPGIYNSPFGSYFNNGSFVISYMPTAEIPFNTVEQLTLHINSYYLPNLRISLWNFEQNAWEEQNVMVAGDFLVQDPELYVSSEGEVRMRFENRNPSNASVSVEQADFTLVVGP